jgi:hypothetical protein
MEIVHAAITKQTLRNWKAQDWIEHSSFGLGQVSESRGDRLDIDFINSGAKTILMTTALKPAMSPADFKPPKVKRQSVTSQIKVEPATRRPSRSANALKISPR